MATIIKAGTLTGESPDVRPIAFNYDDVVGKASAYLEQVRQQAGEILAQARKEAEAIKNKAKQEGQAAARAEAQKQLQQEVKQQLQQQLATVKPALDQAIGQIAVMKVECTRQWETNMVKLATAIAGRVIRSEVASNPEIGLPLLREALNLATGSTRIRVRLHPNDVDALGDQVTSLVKQFDKIGEAEIAADDSIAIGSCIVDTEFGTIDQTWDTQLSRIEQELS